MLDLFAVWAQRASLGIVLSTDTAGRGAPDATSNLFVRMRYQYGMALAALKSIQDSRRYLTVLWS